MVREHMAPDNKKRVLLVTWIGTGNYGTSLQSFALHRRLETLGYDVHLLLEMQQKNDSGLVWSMVRKLRNLKSRIVSYIKSRTNRKKRKLEAFNSENYRIIAPSDISELNETVALADVLVSGSDQIWNCYHRFSPFMFLNFAGSTKRIAYASSIGTKGFPAECAAEVRDLLNEYAHIGVREREAVSAIAELTGRSDVRQVVDPTFLLTAKEWDLVAEKAEIEIELPSQFALCYFVGGRDYWDDVVSVARQRGIEKIVILPSLEHGDVPQGIGTVYSDAGPREFVDLIRKAALVLSDSFHACAVSLNLGRQFVAFKRFADDDVRSQNSRIYDLLNRYGLDDCIYGDRWTSREIDFASVKDNLEEDRRESEAWLVKAIED